MLIVIVFCLVIDMSNELFSWVVGSRKQWYYFMENQCYWDIYSLFLLGTQFGVSLLDEVKLKLKFIVLMGVRDLFADFWNHALKRCLGFKLLWELLVF